MKLPGKHERVLLDVRILCVAALLRLALTLLTWGSPGTYASSFRGAIKFWEDSRISFLMATAFSFSHKMTTEFLLSWTVF